MSPERSAPSAVAARWKARMPFSVISRLRSAATRVTVSLRGTRCGAGSAAGAGSGAGSGAGGSGWPQRDDGRWTSGW